MTIEKIVVKNLKTCFHKLNLFGKTVSKVLYYVVECPVLVIYLCFVHLDLVPCYSHITSKGVISLRKTGSILHHLRDVISDGRFLLSYISLKEILIFRPDCVFSSRVSSEHILASAVKTDYFK